MALPTSKTDICNLALSRIGSKTVTTAEITAGSGVVAPHCNRHYEQTRDALLRSNNWGFASERATLVRGSTPPFEYDYSYKLPEDFLLLRSIYDSGEDDGVYRDQHAIEGKQILSNEDACQIKYVKDMTVKDFDPLFIEVLVLSLAVKLVMPLSQDRKLYAELRDELKGVMSKARVVDKQESNTVGRGGVTGWSNSRY